MRLQKMDIMKIYRCNIMKYNDSISVLRIQMFIISTPKKKFTGHRGGGGDLDGILVHVLMNAMCLRTRY